MATQNHTPGPWIIATSNSYRRILSERHVGVCEPITQSDGHPDLHFRNGGFNGPDARLIAAAPELLEACMRCVGSLGAMAGDTDPDVEFARAAIAKATQS